LDEVGELPLTLQAKVLKFIESRAFRRIGGAAEISVDLSIIASTNRDMEVAIANGRFRRDLYYRLNVIPISVPPLRERGGDVTSIAEYWIEHCCRKFAKCPIHFDDGVREAFLTYDWPGNVRELKNLIERLVILSGDTVIRYEDLPEEIRERALRERPRGTGRNLDQILFEVEEALIRDALKKARGVKSEAAKLLGISRYALLRKMQRLRMTDLF
jgi:two-component system response regulator AtoC